MKLHVTSRCRAAPPQVVPFHICCYPPLPLNILLHTNPHQQKEHDRLIHSNTTKKQENSDIVFTTA